VARTCARFSLDYLVLPVMRLAIGGRRSPVRQGAIVTGIAINLFAAIAFDRSWTYYRFGGNAYDVAARTDAGCRIRYLTASLVTMGMGCAPDHLGQCARSRAGALVARPTAGCQPVVSECARLGERPVTRFAKA